MFLRKKYYTAQEAHYNLGGTIVNPILEEYVAKSLSKIPIKIADKAIKNCFFAALQPGSRGQYFSAQYMMKTNSLILIDNRYLKRAKPECIEFTILHEIAHWLLKHDNIFDEGGNMTKFRKQEKDADNQAKKWLTEWNNANPITKLDSNQWTKEYWKSKGIIM